MQFAPQHLFNSIDSYWLMHSVLFVIISIYIYNKSKKTITTALSFLTISAYYLLDALDRIILLIGYNYDNKYTYILIFFWCMCCYIYFSKNQYNWNNQESDNYNRYKVQAVYSKPDELTKLLGAAILFSPKCSVRYTYLDNTIRFKKGSKTPIMCKTVIKESDIIRNTDIKTDDFFKRFEEIKNINYNIFSFNCKNLFNEFGS